MDPETSTLWFAGKQMQPEKALKDFVGRHEKSKVVVKLQKKGSGAPAREPVRQGGCLGGGRQLQGGGERARECEGSFVQS